MNASTVILAYPYFTDERIVTVGNLSTSIRVNGSGRISFHVSADDAYGWGFDELKGIWVLADTAFGLVGGWIEDDPADIGSGILECSCTDMYGNLEIAITPRTYRSIAAAPGALISRVIRDSFLDEPSWFTEMVVDEHGQPVIVEYRGDTTDRVVQGIANRAGGNFWIETTSDRDIIPSYLTEPTDLRDQVLIGEGREVIAGSIRPSLSQVVNDLTAVANDRDWQRAAAARVIDETSIARYNQRRRATKLYAGHTRASSIEPVAQDDMATLAWASGPVSLSIWDEHPICGELQIASLVTLWGATNNKTFDLTITGLAHDTTQHLVIVAGSVQEQE